MIKHLCIFDFDGTLFYSPSKPSSWKGGWWGRNCSLLPPYVPHHSKLLDEGKHLLNEKVVDAYFQSKMNEDTHTVMMTGRHWGLRHEVMNILKAFGLASQEDHEKLKEKSNKYVFISGGNTLEGKLKRIDRFMADYHTIETITMWEDRKEHIEVFSKLKFEDHPNFKNILIHQPPDWL